MCFESVSANISQVARNLRWAIFILLIICMDCSCGSFDAAKSSADSGQDNFHAFNVLLDLLQIDQLLYEEYRRALEDPASSIVFRLIIERTPLVLPTLQLAEEGGILRLRPGMQLFPSVNLSGYHGGGNEKVVIARRMTGLTKERIREVSAKLVEPYSNMRLSEEGFYRAICALFKRMRMPIRSSVDKPATMDFRTYFGLRGVHEIAERFQHPCANPPISYTEPLDPNNYALSYTGSLVPYDVPSLVSEAFESLTHCPIPSRSIKAHVLEIGMLDFEITDEHTEAAHAAAPGAAAPIAAAPTAAAPVAAVVAVPAAPANDAITEDAAPAPVTAEHGIAVMNDIFMDDGATERPQSNFGPNLVRNPEPDPVTRGIISADGVNPQLNIQDNRVKNTNDDSIIVLECPDMNRGHKRGANARLVQNGSTTPKRQAIAEERAEIKAMLEAAKRNAENQAEHNAATQSRLEALISKFDADIQAYAAAIKESQAREDSLKKEVKMLRAKLRRVALESAKLEKALAEED